MSDVQNEICIAEEAVRGKTLQGGEVAQPFYKDWKEPTLGCNGGHRQQFVDKYTTYFTPSQAPFLLLFYKLHRDSVCCREAFWSTALWCAKRGVGFAQGPPVW